MIEAEIISIGNELLQGRMDDTNATYVARRLLQRGVKTRYRSTCGDAPGDIAATVKRAAARADIVISTGGLGPTVDDTTTGALADMLGVELVKNDAVEEHVRVFYNRIGIPFGENAMRQTYIPAGAKIIMNPQGTAPCIIVKHDRAAMAFFPGVPREMKSMLDTALDELLAGTVKGAAASRTLRIFGVGESSLETIIPTDITTSENPSFSFLPADFEVHLRLTAHAGTREECDEILEKQCARIYECAGEYIYGEGDEGIEAVVLKILKEKNLTLAIAESLTGGMVAARIVNVPGASDALKGGVVAYQDEAKMNVLGVSSETLAKHGAVSGETAVEMARGALEKFNADVGLSTTGNAGPDAQGKAPVGQVYVAVAFRDAAKPPAVKGRKVIRDRNAVRNLTTVFSLDLLRRSLLGV